MYSFGLQSSPCCKKMTANWKVDSQCTAIVSKGASCTLGGQASVLAGVRSGLNCCNRPLGKPSTSCFPLGDQQPHLTCCDLSSECSSKFPPSFRAYMPSPPLLRTTAKLLGSTGFQSNCTACTKSSGANLMLYSVRTSGVMKDCTP